MRHLNVRAGKPSIKGRSQLLPLSSSPLAPSELPAGPVGVEQRLGELPAFLVGVLYALGEHCCIAPLNGLAAVGPVTNRIAV